MDYPDNQSIIESKNFNPKEHQSLLYVLDTSRIRELTPLHPEHGDYLGVSLDENALHQSGITFNAYGAVLFHDTDTYRYPGGNDITQVTVHAMRYANPWQPDQPRGRKTESVELVMGPDGKLHQVYIISPSGKLTFDLGESDYYSSIMGEIFDPKNPPLTLYEILKKEHETGERKEYTLVPNFSFHLDEATREQITLLRKIIESAIISIEPSLIISKSDQPMLPSMNKSPTTNPTDSFSTKDLFQSYISLE